MVSETVLRSALPNSSPAWCSGNGLRAERRSRWTLDPWPWRLEKAIRELCEISLNRPGLPRRLSIRTWAEKRAAFRLFTLYVHRNIPANRDVPEMLLSRARVSDESLLAERCHLGRTSRTSLRSVDHYWWALGDPCVITRSKRGSRGGGDQRWEKTPNSAAWCSNLSFRVSLGERLNCGAESSPS